jgi:aspartate--ammonia ligase
MSHTYIPEDYFSMLSLYETQEAIGTIKSIFEKKLSIALHLKRVTAPLVVDPMTGLNDDLNGVERPVDFDIPALQADAQVVQSLAKWKRMALHRYDFYVGKGLLTDMNAIRRDEELDNIHSIYVDQWDWEKVIRQEDRTEEYLKDTVKRIVNVICNTLDEVKYHFENLRTRLCREVSFITSSELAELYPDKTPKEREDLFVREHQTAFIMQIGDVMANGERHDGRAPDYDDWALNGDLLFWNPVLGHALEISSMGIRVDARSLDEQLTKAGCDHRRGLPFHKMLLEGKLPFTIGGGIGQSRLCMLLLGKAHIGEVQASVWDMETVKICRRARVELL